MRATLAPTSSLHLTPKQSLLSLLALVASLILVLHRSSSLPEPSKVTVSASLFSEERSRAHLEKLLTFGPFRTVGSQANEKMVPDYIEEFALGVAKETGANVQIERQFGSGSFTLDFLGGFTSVYRDVQNVLVLLVGQAPVEDGILMLSAHYDSPAGAHAASDNAANVANAMEILRVFAHEKEKNRRSILFMFTGAEETILQGSHMFSTSDHPLVKHVHAFVNVESAGSGGRELFFQTTSSRMARAWAHSAPYPHGSIVGQEVFQSGIIPSDTDFRMYRDVLQIPGIDMANVENGHVYHTVLDTADFIPAGAMQRYGENVLAIMRAFMRDEEFWIRAKTQAALKMAMKTENLDEEEMKSAYSWSSSDEFLIFFDVLGWFVVVLSSTGTAVFTLLGLMIAGTFYRTVLFSLQMGEKLMDDQEWNARRATCVRFTQMLIRSLIYPLGTGILMSFISPMVFYSRQWIIIPLYFAPAFYGVTTSMAPTVDMIEGKDADSKRPTPNRREILSFALGSAVWGFFSLFLLLLGKGSAYLAWLWCVLPPASRMLYSWWGEFGGSSVAGTAIRRRRDLLETREAAVFGTVVGCIVPLILTLQLLLIVIRFFVPITGRSGSRVAGDVIVSLVCGMCTFLVSFLPASLIQLLDVKSMKAMRRYLFYFWAFGVLVATALRLIHGHGASSFSAAFPKRIYAVHVDLDPSSPLSSGENRLVRGSYLWVIDADSSSSRSVLDHVNHVDPSLGAVDFARIVNCDDRKESTVYCGLPWYLPLKNEIPQSVLIPTENGIPKDVASRECLLTLTKREPIANTNDNVQRYFFTFRYNERANIYFKDKEHGGITNWSFEGEPMATGGHLYVLLAAGNVQKGKIDFWVESPATHLDVAWACHFTEETTEELTRFIVALPVWTTPVSLVSRWKDARFA